MIMVNKFGHILIMKIRNFRSIYIYFNRNSEIIIIVRSLFRIFFIISNTINNNDDKRISLISNFLLII